MIQRAAGDRVKLLERERERFSTGQLPPDIYAHEGRNATDEKRKQRQTERQTDRETNRPLCLVPMSLEKKINKSKPAILVSFSRNLFQMKTRKKERKKES